ncbi:hypothetical protein, conserved [Plasmodium gonderi]|uniref:Uncharacterized protein n=1 Tax=Plasmodium gonderi TaxID=77519 RepID=A0A1Y1JMN1_PLAGO|nr:hypothetical protein, conserved [Plasmodium gonderi]GAW81653.1 hypothetical protein, conserved [Plasmodium gonderi]
MLNLNIIVFPIFYISFIISITNQLSNNGKTLKNLFTRISHEVFSHEQVIKNKKIYITLTSGCPFDNEEKKSTFDCVRRKLFKCSEKLFNTWSKYLSRIYPNEKIKREKIYNEGDYYIVAKKGINEKLNYIDLSSFNTYCSFYKLYVSDLVHFSEKTIVHNETPYRKTKIMKRYFVKTDHLNSDPLDENSYIFILGSKKESLQLENEKSPHSKIYITVNNRIHYYYVSFMSKQLDHTFYFVFNRDHNKDDNKNGTSDSYIFYKNEVIQPFRIDGNDSKTFPFKKESINNDETRDFYIIEICHTFSGITYKQNIYGLLRRLSILYFNIELVPYTFHLPPIFYHVLIILIFSLTLSYIFYKIFLKYKNCF